MSPVNPVLAPKREDAVEKKLAVKSFQSVDTLIQTKTRTTGKGHVNFPDIDALSTHPTSKRGFSFC